MSDEKSEITFEVSERSISMGAKGSSANRLTDAVADALSPFSEGLGYLGDVIRFYRQDMALRSIDRAVELSKKLGLPMKPVAPKFLVDWVEKASLESTDEPEMTNLWAGLLVSASRTPSPTHYVFKRILSEMTREHVSFLADFCDHDFLAGDPFCGATDFSTWKNLADDREAHIEVEDTEESLHAKLFELENNRLRIKNYEIAAYSKFMTDKKVIENKIKTSIDGYSRNYITKFFIDNGIMDNVSILARIKCSKFEASTPSIEIHALYLTEFGVLFLQSCQPGVENTREEKQK